MHIFNVLWVLLHWQVTVLILRPTSWWIGNNVYRIVFLPVHKNGTALRALRRSRDAGVVKKEKGRRRLVRDRSSNFLVSAPSIGSHDPPFFIYIDFPFLSPCHSFLLFCLLLELLLLFDRDNFKAKPRPNPINSKSKPKEKNRSKQKGQQQWWRKDNFDRRQREK